MTDVPPVPPVSAPRVAVIAARVAVIAPSRRVHLYSRPHIDLQRVAAALCRS